MKRFLAFLVLLTLALGGCGRSKETASKAPPPPDEPLFEGLGPHTRAVTTKSEEAQRYFDQGLAFLFAFNHDEAIRSFRRASRCDPDCAMAYWGIAVANGPHINNPMVDSTHAAAAWEALTQAQSRAGGAKDAERALIEAAGKRYADPQPADRRPLEEAYAAAMREVWRAHPRDADVGALFAEALMDLRPWDLWKPDGSPQPGTLEVLQTLEAVLALDPAHPLANHLYIHAVEASPNPEKGDAAAARLRDMEPGLGHMVHMPSHIDVRRGRWKEAELANRRAIEVDRKYREISPNQGFYRIYMAHNHHMLAYAAMMQGESAVALEAIRNMVLGIPEAWVRENAAFVDGFMAMPLEVMMRFGRWDEILAAPEYADYLPIARALRFYARGVARAATGMVAEAEAEQKAFLAAKARVPQEAFFGNNSANDLLNVAEHFLAGEILYRAGKQEEGISELREAARQEDAVRYDEPPDWIQPVRHALGATLLQSGRSAEAEEVYRADLKKLPGNGWSLFGLARSLRLEGKDAEAAEIETRFQKIWENADVKLSSSCFCQPGV